MVATSPYDEPPTRPDPGLFGPESVTWRVHAEPVLWIAGLRALYLQALHPQAVRLVAEYSDFDRDAWGRLFRTAAYVGVTTFGGTQAAEHAAERVRRIHAALPGVDSAELLLWVHVCEVDSFLSTTRRSGLGLTDAQADRYVDEQRRAAALVGLDPDGVPSTSAELTEYLQRARPRLAGTAQAYDSARFILAPPMPAWVALLTPARPAWASAAGLAFALLPRWARRLYGAPGLPTTDLAAAAALRSLRRGLAVLPPRLLEGPHLREARQRLRGGRELRRAG
ncbi:MAG: oxygenase MpaB family protein [Actinomycetes bacterium]